MKKLLIATTAILLVSGAAAAQNPGASPAYGSVSLNAGFTPDPYTVQITSGGSMSASNLPGNCRGWVANAPDFDLYYTAGSFDLTIAAMSNSDTTLVVNGPNGQWYCNDDGGAGLNPLLTFNSPQSGLYDIWIGSYSQGDNASATLSISEIGQVAPHNAQPAYTGPDVSLPAAYGDVRLNTGFQPDPFQVNITSGGFYRASTVRSGCAGWVAAAPDYQVTYSAGSLPLIFSANSNSDTTLLINDPNGNWYCDDDGGDGLNPEMTFSNPASGVYDVWIGSYSEGDSASATLSVSEISYNQPVGPTGPDVSLPAAYGNVRLNTGFQPDPYQVNITSGGYFRASSVRSGCAGWVAAAPDYQLTYSAGSLPLIFSAASNSDTTLLINDPNGNWYCDDDGGDGLNPEMNFSNPSSGVYDIWIGSYSEGDSATATLSISELSYAAPSGPNVSLPAAYGDVRLNSGFAPDPYRVSITSGGQFRASSVQSGCRGWVAAAPDYQLTFSAGNLPLIISAASNSDTTLLVNDPNGNWHCDDDGGNAGLNPALTFNNAASGVYDIWIGSYSQGDNATASLSISELYSE
jgi:hypothetical protein